MSTSYWNKRKTRETRMPNNYEYKSSSIKAATTDFKLLYCGAKRIAYQKR